MRFSPDAYKPGATTQAVRNAFLALSLAAPHAAPLSPETANASEVKQSTSLHLNHQSSTRIEFDQMGRAVREVCDAECWIDTLEPDTGAKLFREHYRDDRKCITPYDYFGDLCLNFSDAKVLNPNLTEIQYIRDIARRFKTIEALDRYFTAYFQYTADTPDPSQPLKIGKNPDEGDYWQTAKATLNRIVNGKYLGDCDDLAFLAQAILQEQGHMPLVVFVAGPPGSKSGHARCVWIERDGDLGRYHANALCTMRYAQDGTHAASLSDSTSYANAQEALQALVKRYSVAVSGTETHVTLGEDNRVLVLSISALDARDLRHYAPVTAFTDPDLYLDLELLAGRSLKEIISTYRERLARDGSKTNLHLNLIAALRREALPETTSEIESSFQAACSLEPNSHECRDQFGRFCQEQQQRTKALHQFLLAIRLGSKSDFVLHQLGTLTPNIQQYLEEFGADTLVETLPAWRFAIHANGYHSDDVEVFRRYTRSVGRLEEAIPVLAGRANKCSTDTQSLSEAFVPRGSTRNEYIRALANLLHDQLEVGQVSEAHRTFVRMRDRSGPLASVHSFLPSLRGLVYKEEMVTFYVNVLEEHATWWGGQMEVAEYLHSGGQYDRAVERVLKAATFCNDFPTMLKDLEALPHVTTHERWPEIVQTMEKRRAELREVSKKTYARRH